MGFLKRRKSWVWIVLGLLVVIGVGVLMRVSLPSTPERATRELLEVLVQGDLPRAWSYATEEERSKANVEAFAKVYRTIVWSQLRGWKLDSPVRVTRSGDKDDHYVDAEAFVKCGNGVRFKARVWLSVRHGRLHLGVVQAFAWLLIWYLLGRDEIPYEEAVKKFREEFVPIFVEGGIDKYYKFENARWYRWDGSVVLEDL